ncbi:MAG TPA: xanthine dehydrogenase family protein molybdopterin-binding subunit [Xanthobacteraceae bacterium]|nr:xanthine dehydrogenase family protein molybdopterin-binding subunit [Xanthobacteraceae bacterium]
MADHPNTRATWVGRSLRRVEDASLLTGQGGFTANLPAARWVSFVRSPVASGRIAGVRGPNGAMVVTAADIAAIKPITPMLHKFNYVPISQHVLAADVVRFIGEPLAAVVAPTPQEAEDLAGRVVVEIDASPPVVDAVAALAPGAPLVHRQAAGNVVVDARVKTVGFDAAIAAAHRRIRSEIRSHRQNATPLEPRAAHAAFDPASRRVTLHCTTQMPHLMRTIIAELIGMPEAELRVIAPDVGGGFGQKMSLSPEFVLVTWLARKLRTSVAWAEDRRENLIACFHARDQRIALEGAFDADGRLTALFADVVANIGAYSCYPTTCGVEPLMAMAEMPGPYAVGEYACVSRGVVTHTCPMAPYRGVSRPVITFAIERLMDKAAAALGLDPVEIRRRNLVKTFPHTSATGLVFDEATYVETMEAAVVAARIPQFRARQVEARRAGRYLGLGIATFSERTGYGTPAFAARGMEVTPGWEAVDITVDPSGFVEARIGASPHGQGLRTTLAQIIADEIGTAPERITIVHGDTDRTPYGWGTFASRSLVIAGGASLLAARKVRAKLAKMAGILLEASADDIVIEADVARVAGTDRAVTMEALARAAYHQTHRFKGEIAPGIAENAVYDPAGTFSNACHLAIVEVDIETGQVLIEKFIVAEDAGRLINPMIVDGQIRGGVTQGIANALFEEVIYDADGNVLTATLADFLPPTARETPTIEIHHLATLTQASVTRAKGLGEGGAIGAPAAVVNAVNDALSPFGAVIDEFPATPRRVLAALQAAGKPR